MTKSLLFILICVLTVGCIVQNTYASQYYVGELHLPQSKSLKIGFSVEVDSGNKIVSAKMDVPQQQLLDYPVSIVKSNIDSVIFAMDGFIKAQYFGQVNADSIHGVWVQSGQSFTLNLKRGIRYSPNRPQTPMPPFPYIEKKIVYYNKDRSIKYGATLTFPENKKMYRQSF